MYLVKCIYRMGFEDESEHIYTASNHQDALMLQSALERAGGWFVDIFTPDEQGE